MGLFSFLDSDEKKGWYADKAAEAAAISPAAAAENANIHPFASEIERLTEKYAAEGKKDFTKTSQFQVYQDYLNPDKDVAAGGGVPASRIPNLPGVGLGAILENDPVFLSGNTEADEYRKSLIYEPGDEPGTWSDVLKKLTVDDIKGINTNLAWGGLRENPSDYMRFNQMLYSPNMEAYKAARPFQSGDFLNTIMENVLLPAPVKWGIETLSDAGKGAYDYVTDDLSYDLENTLGSVIETATQPIDLLAQEIEKLRLKLKGNK